jgi:heme O synthase-like polyprenyltransferase
MKQKIKFDTAASAMLFSILLVLFSLAPFLPKTFTWIVLFLSAVVPVVIILIAMTEAWGTMADFVPQPLGNLYFASTIYMTIMLGAFIHMRKR